MPTEEVHTGEASVVALSKVSSPWWSGSALEHTPTHDPSALLYATDPSLYTTRKIRCRVECKGEFTRGMIVPDLREYPFEANFVNICVDVDGTRALEKLIAAFTRE